MTNNLEKIKRVKYVLESLAPISRRLNAIDCRSCNGYADTDWGRAQEKRDNGKEVRLEKEGRELAQSIGLKFYHQTDPRGCSVYLIDSTMNDSNYSSGIAI
jgi:hypothetical protein